MSADANARVRAVIEDQVNAGREIGVQVAAYLDGKLAVDTWAGMADPDTGRPVDGETLFDVYSVTKAVTLTALHLQVGRGLLEYDAPVVHYWPEYGARGKEATTVRDVITHRSGVPQMPEGVTPEKICDWEWMVAEIAKLKPIALPGSRALYQSLTFGWLAGELIRRSDPHHRLPGAFVRDELAAPLGITDLWIGLPDEAAPRRAKPFNMVPEAPPEVQPALALAATPIAVSLKPEVYGRPDVRRAGNAAVGGIFNARSCARLFAMLAQGGALDGVRLLPEDLVRTFNTPRSFSEERDEVMYGTAIPLSIAGYWLGGDQPPVCSAKSPRAICHPGMGNSIAWADFDTKLAVSICHNRMFQPMTRAEDSILPIADAVRSALNLD